MRESRRWGTNFWIPACAGMTESEIKGPTDAQGSISVKLFEFPMRNKTASTISLFLLMLASPHFAQAADVNDFSDFSFQAFRCGAMALLNPAPIRQSNLDSLTNVRVFQPFNWK
jgi:hypothetical protein